MYLNLVCLKAYICRDESKHPFSKIKIPAIGARLRPRSDGGDYFFMSYVKKPCKHCPFRNDVKPYLHPDRSAEIAYAAQNPYSDFPCHKTTVADDDSEDGEMLITSESKTCAGFLTLRAQDGENIPEGFEPSWEICYTDAYEMIDAYEEEWNK